MIGNKKPSYKGGFSVNLLLTWDILPLLVCTPLCFVRRSTRIQKTAHKDGFSVNSPLVRMKGLEPSRPEALAPKASVSTNSTTSANHRYLSCLWVNLLLVLYQKPDVTSICFWDKFRH